MIRWTTTGIVLLTATALSGCVQRGGSAPTRIEKLSVKTLVVEKADVAVAQVEQGSVAEQVVQSQTVATPVRRAGVDEDGEQDTGAGSPDFQVVRYIGVDATPWKPVGVLTNYSDLYTRVLVNTDEAAGLSPTSGALLRDYRAEKRSKLARIFAPETRSVTTVAKITVKDPSISFKIPLFSTTQASGSKTGNSWETFYTASSIESPLFRIGPNTGMTIHLAAKVSKEVKAKGLSLAIEAVTTAVRIAAPAAPLLTTLSKPELSNAANALDNALSGLLSSSMSEDIEVGRLANSWKQDAHIVLLSCAPFVRTEQRTASGAAKPAVSGKPRNKPPHGSPDQRCAASLDMDGDYNVPVGKWKLSFACPRLSVFDTRDICHGIEGARTTGTILAIAKTDDRKTANKIIAASVSDAQVLSFSLASQVSVQSYVQAQPWFTAFSVKSPKARADYDAFCGGAIVALQSEGLNQLDAALVLRTMIRQLPQLAGIKDMFAADKDGRTCHQAIVATGADTP